jgi:integrase/recombinase XerD
MARRSNKSIAEILAPSTPSTDILFPDRNKDNSDNNPLALLERKISLATEGFTTKFCELVLKDRSRLSKENALTVCDYIIAMKREINPRLSYKKYTIQFLSELSRAVGIEKKFIDMIRDDVLCYLDKCRKPENEDPLHKWIGSYNTKLAILCRFFKWLHYPDIEDPKRRSELSALERKPDCIRGIKQLKRKEISCYKPSDLWTQEDDLVFLKWVTNKRDRCYHTMARDLSARPHEILNLKIKDIVFKTVDGSKQYAIVVVNGKTGSRSVPLFQSIPYVKQWLSDHPSRNNSNSPLFVGLSRNSMSKQLTVNGLYGIYKDYKENFFPKLLKDSTIPHEDKERIKALLLKPFTLYVRRHSALTEKSTKLKSSTLNQHAGWQPGSNMAQVYIHYFGNESSESLLEAYGIVTKNNIPIDTLNPKICPNCNEGNTQDAKFCSKCKMIMSFEGYQEALESQSKKEDELKVMKEQFNAMQSQIQALIAAIGNTKDQNQVDTMAQTLFKSGILQVSNSGNDHASNR